MTEFQINRQIEELRQQYHEAVGADEKPSVTRELADQIKDLQEQRSTMLSEGAEECPTCGNKPIGMKKRRGEYEVGCPLCPTRSRGESVEEAVYWWNKGEYVPELDVTQNKVEELSE